MCRADIAIQIRDSCYSHRLKLLDVASILHILVKGIQHTSYIRSKAFHS
jgi:hypothetical protein